MKLSSLSTRTLIAALALGVGVLLMLFSDHTTVIKKLDLTCVMMPQASQQTLYEHDEETDTITIHRLIENTQSPHPFQLVRIGNDPDSIFEKSPPSALDYAVILESLHNHGYRRVNVSTKLVWDESPRLLAAGLDTRLALFESAIVPLSLSRAPTTGAMPPMLNNSQILAVNIRGDASLIPTVNRLTLSPSIQGKSKGTYAGFFEIENIPPAPNKTLMLAQWDDGSILPSATLLTIMQAYGVTPAALIIHCGKHIRLGKNGPVIAIDEYGQAAAPTKPNKSISFSPVKNAETLISRTKSHTPKNAIALIYAEGDRVESTNTHTRSELEQIISIASTYPIPDVGILHQPLPLWAQLVILIDLAILIYWFRGMTRANQHLVFPLAIGLIFMLLFALMDITQHWMPVSTSLAMLIIGWIAPVSKRRTTSSIQEYDTAKPKPVIRA